MNQDNSHEKGHGSGGSFLGGAYGLGFIGALVYYIQNATSFGQGVIGFLKALVWPPFLIHRLMEFLSM